MDDVVRAFLEQEQHLKLGQRLGRGGFAEVYEAHTPQGVPCAIKVSLDPLDDQNPAVQKELENLDLVKSITGHPNIVTLMDYWVVGGYLVTRWELASEGSALEYLHRCQQEGRKGIPLSQLLALCADAAQGIDFLNRQRGIYHRDIKPQNLLVFHGRVKVGDLGLAKFVGASAASHTGAGTVGYLPPEAYDLHRLVPTVDVYGLVATYVKLRTGQEPFGQTPPEVFERQRRGEPVVEGLRPAEVELVCRALAARPEDRPQEGAVAWVRSVYQAVQKERRPKAAEPRARDSAAAVSPPSGQPAGPMESATPPPQTSGKQDQMGAIAGAIGGAIGCAIVGAILGAIGGGIGWAIRGAIYGAIYGAIGGAIEGARGGKH